MLHRPVEMATQSGHQSACWVHGCAMGWLVPGVAVSTYRELSNMGYDFVERFILTIANLAMGNNHARTSKRSVASQGPRGFFKR